MEGRSRWVTRRMECPEGQGESTVLLEWKTRRGKKVLHSITCFNPELMHYCGRDCAWQCLEMFTRVPRT